MRCWAPMLQPVALQLHTPTSKCGRDPRLQFLDGYGSARRHPCAVVHGGICPDHPHHVNNGDATCIAVATAVQRAALKQSSPSSPFSSPGKQAQGCVMDSSQTCIPLSPFHFAD